VPAWAESSSRCLSRTVLLSGCSGGPTDTQAVETTLAGTTSGEPTSTSVQTTTAGSTPACVDRARSDALRAAVRRLLDAAERDDDNGNSAAVPGHLLSAVRYERKRAKLWAPDPAVASSLDEIADDLVAMAVGYSVASLDRTAAHVAALKRMVRAEKKAVRRYRAAQRATAVPYCVSS
jgi:hypothetical protein